MNKERLIKLVSAYKEHFPQYCQASYNETEVRNDFVNPFFEILGWDVLNNKNLPQHLREVKHEADVYVEENGKQVKKKPDYAFYLGADVSFFLETKKPSVDIMTNQDAAFQIRRYGWNGNLKVSVLCNFTDLVIYDTSIRPSEEDGNSVARVAHYHYTEYVDKFDEISRMLSYSAVVSGEFEKIFSNISVAVKKEPFDKYFLNQIQKWRFEISKDIVVGNESLNEASLNIYVQRLINRIVFLRICEDRNLEKYETLKNISNYNELKTLFINADKKYNSGLFELIDDEEFNISDDLIVSIFKELYYPNSCYEFSVVDPYIIGQIYELFLEEQVIIDNGTVLVKRKTEVVDAQGVVNTPKNITEIIVNKTLSSLYTGDKFEEWGDYRIADICCGSGNFLLSAFEYIVNRYIEYYVQNSLEEAIREGVLIKNGDNIYNLSYEKKCEILHKNIWGVDVDILAVEVCKFSLLIKLIENNDLAEIDSYTKSHHCRILPDLDENIKSGNSLVDSNYLMYDTTVLSNFELIEKLKIFDWDVEFQSKKFDAIIGNPPYIRVQNMVHFSTDEYGYFKSGQAGFETAKADLLDMYYLFLERGLQLLTEKGRIGYIVPHKFMLLKSGALLRKVLSEKKCVEQIIHFGVEQVFKGKSTYTCLLFLEGNEQKKFEIGFVDNINEFYASGEASMQEYPIHYLGMAPWTFLSNKIKRVINNVKSKCDMLDAVAEIFVGLQTSKDPIYIVKADKIESGKLYFKDCRGVNRRVEYALTKPCIYDVQLESYAEIEENMRIIFPYHLVDGKQCLYTWDEMERQYPETLEYFKAFKDELCSRSIKNMTDNNWYQFGRSQSLNRFNDKEHLVWAVLSTQGNYVYDNKNICFTGGGNGPFYGLEKKIDTTESIFYIQALLNHWLLESVVKSQASTFRGDYYSHGKQFIAKLPIYRIDFDNASEVQIHDAIVTAVQSIMNLKERRGKCPTKAQRAIYERLIQAECGKLEEMISNLYGAEKSINEVIDEE